MAPSREAEAEGFGGLRIGEILPADIDRQGARIAIRGLGVEAEDVLNDECRKRVVRLPSTIRPFQPRGERQGLERPLTEDPGPVARAARPVNTSFNSRLPERVNSVLGSSLTLRTSFTDSLASGLATTVIAGNCGAGSSVPGSSPAARTGFDAAASAQ